MTSRRVVVASCVTVVLTTLAVFAGVFARSAAPSTSVQSLTYQSIPFDQLDPQRISDGGQDIAGQNLLEGLVTPNAAGTGIVPATADSWKVSSGGTVYTFHIRKDAAWSDGTPVGAQDFEWTYRRLLTPSTSATDKLIGASAYEPDLGIKNAVNFQLGKTRSWSQVGVKALDSAHLRIVLDAPNASFLQELALPSMVALPEHNLTAFPFDWQTPAHWVGNGPFVPQSWTPGSDMILVPNEHYWDRGNVHLSQVHIHVAAPNDADTLARYRSGAVDVARVADPTPFDNDPTLAPALQRLPGFSVSFLTLIPSRNPALRDVRVRKAIALAIDRSEVANVNPLAQPATSLVPRGLPGYDTGVGFRENVARARRLLAAAGYPGGKGFPRFVIMSEGDDPLLRVLVRTLHENLGIRAALDAEDPAVEQAKRHEVLPADRVGYFSTGYTALLSWRNWVSTTYPPSQTELLSLTPDDYTHYQVLQAKGTDAALAAAETFLETHSSPQARRFAAVTAKADLTPDPARATTLYKRAAAIRQATFEFIPYAYRSLLYVVRPGITGVHLWTGYFTISFKDVRVG